MDHLVTLGVGTEGPEDFYRTFQDMSELAANLGVTHNYVSVSSSLVDDDLHEEPAGEDLYYDEDTMRKVRATFVDVLSSRGFAVAEGNTIVDDVINKMQNAGILFRERLFVAAEEIPLVDLNLNAPGQLELIRVNAVDDRPAAS